MTNFRLNLLAYSVMLGLTTGAVYANELEQLQEINVSGNTETINVKEKKVGETKITAKKLSKQQASDSRDLVRYETGITVVETGRTGSSGYAVRGVDENRVGIMVDGLRQAETLSSQAFKELFEGYGNFNNTRNDIEIENVKTATITKGADSLKSGSGALGGSVIFDTKDARDYLIDKNYYVGVKRATQSMNSQNTETITAAGRYKWFDALIVHTERNSNEMKNYGYESYDDNVAGIKREKADPYSIIRRSTLVKFGFQPTENHRFAVAVDNSTLKSEGQDLSYSLRPSKYTSEDSAKNGERRVHDSSKRESLQFSYETFAQTPFWDHLKLTYSTQKITNNARSDEYCQGSKCTNVRNPSNLQLVDNNGYEVKANGESININQDSVATTTSGKAIEESDFFDADSTYINCSTLDCTKPFNLYQKVYNADTFEYSYKKVSRPITIKQLANKKGTYGVVEKTSEDQNLSKKTCYDDYCFDDIYLEKSLVYLLPKAPGYYSSDYNNRDLNTKTTQINLDFDKEFKLFNQLHSVKYGSLYNRIKKDMVNKQGWEGQEIQWWQQAFLGQNGSQPDPEYWMGGRSSYKRSRNGETSSYLIPVTTKNTALYFGDSFSVTNWLGFDLNWRYDKVKHLPNYRLGVDPEIPRGLLAGTMIPIPDSALTGGNGWYNYNHADYIKNVQDNLNAIQKEAKFKHHSYNLGVNFDPINWLRVQLKYSNGFRAPTSDEMYMTFKHPQFSLAPNTNLKAETAKTKEIAFTFYKDRSYFTTNIFQTDYRNFIDLAYLGERPIDQSKSSYYPFYQSVNRSKAKVNGFEIATHLEMGDVVKAFDGFHLGYKLTYQKGKIKDNSPLEGYKDFLTLNPQYREMALQDQPMNALQPITSVYNLGYDAPDKYWGLDFYITDVAAKKAKDSFNPQWLNMVEHKETNPNTGNIESIPARTINGNEKVTDRRHLWRNNHYTIIDAIAYWKPIKNLTFTAGVYNLTNQKYLTWDSARSIRSTGTINRIDTATGIGLNRFYSPGRNYRASIQLEF